MTVCFKPTACAAQVYAPFFQPSHESSCEVKGNLPVTQHNTDRQITTFHRACPPHFQSRTLLAAFRLVIELSKQKGNKAASEAQHTISQLSLGGACSTVGCHG